MPEETLGEVISRSTWTYSRQHLEREECLDDSSIHVTAVVCDQYRWASLWQTFMMVDEAAAAYRDEAAEVHSVDNLSQEDQIGLIDELVQFEAYRLADVSQQGSGHGYLQFCRVGWWLDSIPWQFKHKIIY